jgi:cytochrome c peroxidase
MRVFGRLLLLALGLGIIGILAAGFPSVRASAQELGSIILNLQPFADPTGFVATYNVNGNIDATSPFFQSLGTNGRTCASCHQAGNAMGLSVANVQDRFKQTGGADPLFDSIDGANCPGAKTGDRAAHSLLLQHGLIRVFLPLPPSPEFTITVVHDPYGCAMVTDPGTGLVNVSVYRRPLPTTNLNFLSTVMFDGRETIVPLNSESTFQANLVQDLTHQAQDAINIHAQASPPNATPSDQLASIVTLELGLTSAQFWDNAAGLLEVHGATGGPVNLANDPYYPGINDVLGGDPTGAPFNPTAFTVFTAWQNLERGGRDYGDRYDRSEARMAIAAGEKIFNSTPLTIHNVRGLNDNPALANPISGTCTSCHDTPNVGDHSVALPLDIGTSHAAAYEHDPDIAAALAELDFPDVPVYLVSGCPDPFNPTPSGSDAPTSFYTVDPGKALVTGHCSDFNRGKGPILRGLAARAPYFHDGAAKDLREVVNFYNQRFQMGLSEKEKSELIAFLNSL